MSQVTEYVFEKRAQVITTSLLVAEHFGKAHRDVTRAIDNLVAQNCAAKKFFRETRAKNSRGVEYRSFEMNRDGFSLLCMGFTGKKALDFKLAYIQAFNNMESIILNRVSVDWQRARIEGKEARKGLTDTIAEFVAYATSQGSSSASFYYSTITRETYKALKLLEKSEKVDSKLRDLLNGLDLAFLSSLEEIAKKSIEDGMEEGLHYKEIYLLAKAKIVECGKVFLMATNTKRDLLA